jgi:transcription elongation factor SPT6
VESSDDDLDEEVSNAHDIHAIFDDERPDDESDIDSFIESDEEEPGAMDEESRAERRRQKRKQEAEKRKMARIAHPELAGIDAM